MEVEIDWPGLHRPTTPRRVALPTYPFERQRYWIESDHDNRARDGTVTARCGTSAALLCADLAAGCEPIQQSDAVVRRDPAMAGRCDPFGLAEPSRGSSKPRARRYHHSADEVPHDVSGYEAILASIRGRGPLHAVVHTLSTSPVNTATLER